jgi:plastocyanin
MSAACGGEIFLISRPQCTSRRRSCFMTQNRQKISKLGGAIFAATLLLIAGTAYAAHSTVIESQGAFAPDSLSLKPGDTVTFSNRDDIALDLQIVEEDGTVSDKGMQRPGQEITLVFSRAGIYKVRCAIHPQIKMTVTVR